MNSPIQDHEFDQFVHFVDRRFRAPDIESLRQVTPKRPRPAYSLVAATFALLGVALVALLLSLVGGREGSDVVVFGDSSGPEEASVRLEDLLAEGGVTDVDLGPFVSMRTMNFGVVSTTGPLAAQAGDVAVTLRLQQFLDSAGDSVFRIESQGWFESEDISGPVIVERCGSFDSGELREGSDGISVSFHEEFSEAIARHFPQRLVFCPIPGAGRQLRAAFATQFEITPAGEDGEFVLSTLDGESVVIRSIGDPALFANR